MNFFEQVYQIVKQIPKGKVMTYGQIAMVLGTQDARRIGHALHANNNAQVPCHRVVNREGKVAPGFAFGGPTVQRKRLEQEGIEFVDEHHLDLKKYQFNGKIRL